MRVAAGWLILPQLEAGDNKLTIFKTSGEQERWLTGRKKGKYRWRRESDGEKRKEKRKKERKMVFCP